MLGARSRLVRMPPDHRLPTGGGVTFGAKFSVLTPGSLAVGDEIRAEDRAGSSVESRADR